MPSKEMTAAIEPDSNMFIPATGDDNDGWRKYIEVLSRRIGEDKMREWRNGLVKNT